MSDGPLKAQIAAIISGALKGALKDHPEYLTTNYNIRRSSFISVAKRAAGNILHELKKQGIVLEYVDFEELSKYRADQLAKSTQDIQDRADKKFVDRMAVEHGHQFCDDGMPEGVKLESTFHPGSTAYPEGVELEDEIDSPPLSKSSLEELEVETPGEPFDMPEVSHGK